MGLSIDELIDIAQRTRRNVLERLKFKNAGEIVGRGAGGDFTRRIDRVAEEVIVNELKRRGVQVTFLSEELGIMDINGGGDLFVVDPIDGTTNAIRGVPVFSLSIAISSGKTLNDVYMALVLNFVTGDVFYAEKGKGSYLNGLRLKPSNVKSIDEALIELDLNIRGKFLGYLKRITPIISKARHIRFLGSDALAICLVASGASDAFIDLRGILRITDISAGFLIAHEAGAIIYLGKKTPSDIVLSATSRTPIIVASTKELFNEIMSIIS